MLPYGLASCGPDVWASLEREKAMSTVRIHRWYSAYTTLVLFVLWLFSQSQVLYAQSFCSSGSGGSADCMSCCPEFCSATYSFSYGICNDGGTCDVSDCISKRSVNGSCVEFCCNTQYWSCSPPSCIQEGNYCDPWGTPCCSQLRCISGWCQFEP
jgi:hypothetical protein